MHIFLTLTDRKHDLHCTTATCWSWCYTINCQEDCRSFTDTCEVWIILSKETFIRAQGENIFFVKTPPHPPTAAGHVCTFYYVTVRTIFFPPRICWSVVSHLQDQTHLFKSGIMSWQAASAVLCKSPGNRSQTVFVTVRWICHCQKTSL